MSTSESMNKGFRVKWYFRVISLLSILFLPVVAMGGTLEAPAGPNLQGDRHTLKHIYDLLKSGTTSTAISGAFSGPGPTIGATITTLPSNNTLNDIYDAAPLPDNSGAVPNEVCNGKKFFSLLSASTSPTGTWGVLSGALDCNRPPTAVNDTSPALYSTNEGQSKSILPSDLLSNDIDLDSDTKRVTSVDATSKRGGTITSSGNPVTSITYTPPALDYLSSGASTVDAFTYTMDDSHSHSSTATVFVTINGVNDAPVLSGSVFSLSSINEDTAAPTGDTVAAIIGSSGGDPITDADLSALEGIAVTDVLNTNGNWEYSIDGGSNWSQFGSPTASSARLLNASAMVRFVPNADWFGVVNSGITFRAWDTTSGTNGSTASTTTNGGTTAYSTATATANITVIDVNDPPTFDLKASPNDSATHGAGEQSVSGQATNISGGPNSESSASMTFRVYSNNAAIFSVSPAISSAGTLTYTPHATNTGVATVTVLLVDSADAVSVAKTFTITIN